MATHLMIKKTMTITSLAIFFAVISVATTMTFVQADPTGDEVDIFVSPNATPASNLTALVGSGNEYTGTIGIFVDAELTFTDAEFLDGIINDTKAELSLGVEGVNVLDGVFDFTGTGTDGVVTFTDANADRIVQFTELVVTTNGTMINTPQTAILTAIPKPITVNIDGAAGEVSILLPDGVATLDDIVVEIDDIQWLGESGTISSFECLTNVGATSVALFDKDTLEVTITPGALDTPIAIHCDFEGEHGVITKTLLEPCLTSGVEVKNDTAQVCTFHISYTGANATIIDTLPAEWNATTVVFGANTGTGGGGCTVDGTPDVSTGKNKKANKKSATGFTCEDIGEDAEIDVTVDLRQSPGKGHGKKNQLVFKPTGCDLQINSGAIALLVNVTDGTLVLGTLDGLPLVLNSTDPLDVLVVSSTGRDVDCP
jgi:hypothetical protein